MSEQKEDIVDVLRELAEIPLYCHVPLSAAADEIARLRLTDAEREAVGHAYSRLTADTHYAAVAATLRGLLERTKGVGTND